MTSSVPLNKDKLMILYLSDLCSSFSLTTVTMLFLINIYLLLSVFLTPDQEQASTRAELHLNSFTN